MNRLSADHDSCEAARGDSHLARNATERGYDVDAGFAVSDLRACVRKNAI